MITNTQHGTRIDEIADGIYRITTPYREIIPGGFSFNQFLILDEEPLLFHTGMRRSFPLVSEAISKVMPLDRLRHISYSHFESDEAGAMPQFLAAAPNATPAAGEIGAMVALSDFVDTPVRAMKEGEEISTGKHQLIWLNTPHVPHGWDCGVLFDKTTGTLLCSDLFTHGGSDNPPVTESEILGPSELFRAPMDYFAHSTKTAPILEKLAALHPQMLACMHGSAYRGDGAALLRELSNVLERESNMSRSPEPAALVAGFGSGTPTLPSQR
jgi:flavorubredoxin